MQLKEYLIIVWRRRWVVIATVVGTLCFVALGSFLTPPTYEASATLRVATQVDSSGNLTDSSSLLRLMNTYIRVATTRPVLDELNAQLGLVKSPEIAVVTIPDTELFQITVDDRDAVLAVNAANALAKILIDQSEEFYSGTGISTTQVLSQQLKDVETTLAAARKNYQDLLSQTPRDTAGINIASKSVDLQQQIYADLLQQYEQAKTRESMRATTISVIEPAFAPKAPIKPNIPRNLALGLVASLIAGFGLVFVLENLDTRLYSSSEIEQIASQKVIATIPPVQKRAERHVPLDLNTPLGDAFVRLRSNVLAMNQVAPMRTYLVVSAEKGEGKSTVASNLAFTLAESGLMVVVVDCDMRLPKIHKYFQVPNEVGLSDFLSYKADLGQIVKGTDFINVNVITSGNSAVNPSRLLSTPGMDSLLRMLVEHYQVVILDAPSLLACSDASLLAPNVDGVILVAKRAVVRRENLQTAIRLLNEVRANMLGLVINGVDTNKGYYEYHHRNPALFKTKG